MQNWPGPLDRAMQIPRLLGSQSVHRVHPECQTPGTANGTSLLAARGAFVLLQDPPNYSIFIFPAARLFLLCLPEIVVQFC